MAPKTCRWGILSTANIARKNWKAVRNSGNATITAVASRDLGRAKAFISDCQKDVPLPDVPAACGSYEELLGRTDVDAVYVPLPTGIRKEWVIRAAEAGKHVLCEKPCGINARDVQEMVAACQANRVQFMDGVMFMHSQRLPKLREVLDDGQSVGQIRRITTQFSFRAPDEFIQENIRVSSVLEPLGCLGDLGWYTIRFILWVMNYQMPHSVSGRLLAQHGRADSPDPVPMEFSGELFFGDQVSASFYCSFLTEHQQWANVSGSKGFVQVPDFVLPVFGSEAAFDVCNAVFYSQGCDFNMESHIRRVAVSEYSNSFPNSQETNLIRNFSDLVLSGKPDPFWGEIAIKTQKVMDTCLESAKRGSRNESLR